MNREELALCAREHVIRMAGRGGCFLGASLSCTDILVHLYTRVLDVTPATVASPARDYLLLSKGHDVPALYGVLAELGFFDRALLDRHLDPESGVYWHPSRRVPGVEFHSGSLGHLLSVAAGIALAVKLSGGKSRVFVLLGDGELDEGSVWEAFLVAAAGRLDNLVAIVDRNGFQANLATEELVPLEPLAAKLDAFGWNVCAADGHDFDSLERAFAELAGAPPGRPRALVARTVRNKGLPSLEGRAERWFVRLSAGETDGLLAELRGGDARPLHSRPMVVR
jgi:transketolase